MKQYHTKIGTDVNEAIHHLERDELVGIPTETVYGLAANAFSEKAVQKVFDVKKRPLSNPLIVHVDRLAEVAQLVREIPEAAEALLERFAPGPLTLILKKNSLVSNLITAGRFEVAVRIPAHPLTLHLLRQLDFPLVAPSANIYTTISPTLPEHVVKNFAGEIPYVLDGGSCHIGLESTVVGFERNGTPVIYRQGAITAEEIRLVAGNVVVKGNQDASVSPGLSPHHYSPHTPLLLMEAGKIGEQFDPEKTGLLVFCRYQRRVPLRNQFLLSARGCVQEAARNLYRGLHYLDEKGLDLILAETCPPNGLGRAINDRLVRASYPYSGKLSYKTKLSSL